MTRSPFFTPSDCIIAATRFTSSEQLLVGKALRLVHLGRDPDQRLLARRAPARWRSTALWQRLVSPPTNQLRERRAGVVEHLAEGLVPVDRASPPRPRSLRGRRSTGDGNRGTSSLPSDSSTISAAWPGSPSRCACSPRANSSAASPNLEMSALLRKRSTRSTRWACRGDAPGRGLGTRGGGAAGARPPAPRCSRCSARRIRSSIEFAGSYGERGHAEAADELQRLVPVPHLRLVAARAAGAARRASICGAAVPAATTMKASRAPCAPPSPRCAPSP